MSLGSALATAMSGLRANQAALSIVSSNIANVQTPGYVAQSVNQVEVTTGDIGSSVMVTGVNRQLNQFVQSQLRTETAGGAYAVTDQSGPAIIGASGTISGSSLEGSNTDIAEEFTKLIVTQQAYSANAKVITTANTMVQDLLNVLR